MIVYLAGPLFTPGERMQNSMLADQLTLLGYEVILPQDIMSGGTPTGLAVFNSCLTMLDSADIVVGCMDGRDSDSGTAWEIGASFRRVTTILYYTDCRFVPDTGRADNPFNCMLYYSADKVIDAVTLDMQQLAAAIHDAIIEKEYNEARWV